MTFIPFAIGKRNCLGKTFAEIVIRIVLTFFLKKYEIEFEDPLHYNERPLYNALMVGEPIINVQMKKRRIN
jgi:cytochrome P450